LLQQNALLGNASVQRFPIYLARKAVGSESDIAVNVLPPRKLMACCISQHLSLVAFTFIPPHLLRSHIIVKNTYRTNPGK
jgi:hypothetical protein